MKGVYFNGKWITKPGAYAAIDADMMTSMTTGSPNIVALIGPSSGGIPGEIMWFDDPTSAKNTLKGGYLMKAAEKAWSPTKTGGGAQLIAVIRANKAIQSSLVLGDDSPVLSKIGEVINGLGNTSTGKLVVSGKYTGNEDKELEVFIDSEGTVDYTAVTYRWRIKADPESTWKAENISDAQNGVAVELTDGVSIKFEPGNYDYGDTFTIPLYSEKEERTAIKITSKDYGQWTNKIQVKQDNGTIPGTKRINVFYWGEGIYETYDNLGAVMFLQYTGDQPYAIVEVIPDRDGVADKLITKIGASADDCIVDLEINLKDDRYKQIRQLSDYISSFENYECEFYAQANQSLGAQDLDIMTANIKDKEALVSAFWADLTKTIPSKSKYIDIKRIDKDSKVPVNYPYTSLQGGSDGTMPASWVEYFDKLSSHPITYIVPVTGDNAIHAEARAHVDYMSNTMGRERFLICGGYAGETVEDAKKRAQSHNSDRTQLAFPGFYDYGTDGELVLYPSFITAAMLAGRAAYKARGEASTFDLFDVEALEYELEPSQINELLNAGVANLEFVINKGNRLVQDLTTYTQNDKSLYTERSVRILADSLNKELRERIEELIIGKKGSRTPITSVKNLVISFLKNCVKNEELIAYRNVRVTYSSRVLNVEYEAAPVEPVNFALIKGHFYTEEITV